MSLIVIDAGLFATVQDDGRPGWLAQGVARGGPADCWSHSLANALVGNPAESVAATLELTLTGGCFEATCSLALALTGAPMAAGIAKGKRRPRSLRPPCSFTMRAGERLVLGHCHRDARAYLSVAGGWRTPLVLDSRSSECRLSPGDELPVAGPSRIPARFIPGAWPESGRFDEPLGLLSGPDLPALEGRLEALTQGVFQVGATSNRVGIRLEGPPLHVQSDPARLSAPVLPGAVQVAGSQAIVLGVACGTVGGYPHVAQVATADIWRLGQLRPGRRVRFRTIGLEEARRRYERQRKLWRDLLLRTSAAARDGREGPD